MITKHRGWFFVGDRKFRKEEDAIEYDRKMAGPVESDVSGEEVSSTDTEGSGGAVSYFGDEWPTE